MRKYGTDPSSAPKVLSYGEKFGKIGPVHPEILDKTCQTTMQFSSVSLLSAPAEIEFGAF